MIFRGSAVNIFVTSQDPTECAVALDDKRLVKMILESVQMLSTAIARHGGTPVYRVAWAKHPCTIWTGDSRANYEWHLSLLNEMNKEYSFRYGYLKGLGQKDHASFTAGYQKLIDQVNIMPTISQLTQFPNCSLFKDESDVIKAYRLTMLEKWKKDKLSPKWTGRNPPVWNLDLR